MDNAGRYTRDNSRGSVAFGVVTKNDDPQGQGRVRVKLPWLDKGDDEETTWATLGAPMHGDKFGWYALPDVGDVVAVVFVDGDLQHPVVLGGVWSKTDAPPEASDDGKNNFRGYRSRSGHRLIFDDSGSSKVVLADKDSKHMIGVGTFAADGDGPNKCGVLVPAGAGSGGVALAAMTGTFQVACPSGTLTLDAGGDVMITASTSIAIKATGAMTAKGSTAKISSSAPGVYQGATVEIA